MSRIEVGLDALAFGKPGADRGLGRYASELQRAVRSSRDLDLLLVQDAGPKYMPEILRIERALQAVRRRVDLYHSTGVYHLPLRKSLPWVCSIQDTIPLDLKDYQRLGLRSKLMFRNSRRADVIFANSRYTSQRVATKLDVDPQRIFAAPIPIDNLYFAAEIEPENRESRRRIRYVAAMADGRSPDLRKRYHWIEIVGAQLLKVGIKVVVAGRGLEDEQFPSCEIVHNPSVSRLADLYCGAICFYYPSAYEGQGLPPLEAMAAGCPVVAYSNTAVSEMVGVEDFLLHDPIPWTEQRLSARLSSSDAQKAVERITRIEDCQQTMRSRATAQAQTFRTGVLLDELMRAYHFAVGVR